MNGRVYRLPPAFYEDHRMRDLPSGEIDRETKQAVFVRLDRAAYDEILSDARHYAYNMAPGGFDEYGLISSARATVRALEKQGAPTEG